MGDAIRLEGVSKSYGGRRGVDGLDLAVPTGTIFGYLGPNGAGKTTTIRLLLDLIRPTAGRVEVLGGDPRRDGVALRRRIGYLPGDAALYGRLTGRELVGYFGSLRGGVEPARVAALAGRLDLDLDRPIRTLSKGNRQKVGLVQAFAHAPELLVLDEPTAGLDPLVQQSFNALLREAAAEGRTVFLSSHVLSEVQEVAGRVGIVREGRIVAVEDVETLRGRAVRELDVLFAGPAPRDALAAVPGVRDLTVEGPRARFLLEGEADPLVKELARHAVADLRSREPDLEDVFLSYYADDAR